MRNGDDTLGLATAGLAIEIRRIVVDKVVDLLVSIDFSSVVKSRTEASLVAFFLFINKKVYFRRMSLKF